MVSMADGTQKPIKDVERNDAVLCFYYDEEKGVDVITVSIVEQTHVHDVWETYRFGFENGVELNVTHEHPLYVEKGAFRVAGYTPLKQKYAHLSRSLYGSYGMEKYRVTSMLWNDEPYFTGQPIQVYNLTVTQHPTYFANGIGVHNTKPIDPQLP
jgi:intein/homing endonuclease